MKYTKADVEHAKEMLNKFAPIGATIYTVIRSVARSGMSRRMDLYCIYEKRLQYLTGYAAMVLGYRVHPKGGISVSGCGMDMGFHIVNSLSYTMHGYPKDSKECRTKQHGERPRPGYTYNHEWI